MFFITLFYLYHHQQQLGFLWLPFAIHPYQPSYWGSPLDSLLCLHRADRYKFLLVGESMGKKSLLSSSLLLYQCPTCLDCLSWMACGMGGKWLYNCCFLGCCFVQKSMQYPCIVPINIFFNHFVIFQVVQLYSCTDMATAWKNSWFLYSYVNLYISK